MSSPSKLTTLPEPSPAEKRQRFERAAMLELRAYKRTERLTAAQLAMALGYSPDAVERWLTGAARVPGGVIIAIRGGKVAA
jgi:DNA-binding transcriptional ArsR family regulator